MCKLVVFERDVDVGVVEEDGGEANTYILNTTLVVTCFASPTIM